MLGSSDLENFKYFCHGIQSNSTLQELNLVRNDLRTNSENRKTLELFIKFSSRRIKINLNGIDLPGLF